MNNDTFDALYEKYWLAIYASAYKRVFDPKKASEITHEAFFQLWLNKDHKTTEEVIVFLLKAVRNEILILMKRECINIANPPTRLFEPMQLPGAN